MPALGDNRSDSRVVDVVNYVRSHCGNRTKGEARVAEVQVLR
jgi:hypothetical protein